MNLHPSNFDAFSYAEEELLTEAKRKAGVLRAMLERCDSPLEQKFLLDWLYYTGHEFGAWQNPDTGEPFLYFECSFDSGSVRIANQVPLTLQGRNCRLDFLLAYTSEGFTPSPVLKLAIEIDGHNFHERTKAQAKRDRSRDRALTSAGYTVFRFTGAEIYAPFVPMKSPVSEVGNILHSHERRVAEAKGLLTPHTYSEDSWRER
jgi:hypothetical protein